MTGIAAGAAELDAIELREALIGRVRIPEPGDAGLDTWQRPHRPGQAGQGEAGRKPTSLPPAVIVTRPVSGVTASSCAGWPAAKGRRMSLVVAPE
jgi:hypothetical protein